MLSCIFSIQRLYIYPAVTSFWENMQEEQFKSYGKNKVSVCGDGRCDSPGFSAQYMTYSFMDMETHKILTVNVVEKREVEGKSPNMEKLGFLRGMVTLQSKLQVSEVATDAHCQIRATLRK